MKIEYNILWLDDAKQEIEEGEYHLELFDFVKSLGFLPQIELVRTEKEFFEVLNIKQWDLIMTDYNLDEISENPEKGDEVIGKIRKKDVLTEILFYTKKDDKDRKVGFNRITFIDTSKMPGTIHNEKVLIKAKELIELTVRKFQNIVVMRGMIMNETSSLDIEFTDILEKIILNNEQAIIKIKERYKKFNSDNINEAEALTLKDLLYKIGASHRWKGLKENIAKDEVYKILLDYEEDIIITRNKFAHAILEEDENGRKYFKDKKGGIDFNEEKCKEIRINISKHKQNIINLKSKLP
ncbi:MAG: hypothetical protein KBA06_00795 [Saprospiraceae bacterium]|nr:hypothetical protein [Saprospiraceae bacterium]